MEPEVRSPTLAERFQRLAEYCAEFGSDHAAAEAQNQAEAAAILEAKLAKQDINEMVA